MSTATFFLRGKRDFLRCGLPWHKARTTCCLRMCAAGRRCSGACSGLTTEFVQSIRVAANRLVVVQRYFQQREAVVIGDRLTGLHVIDID